MLVHASSMKCLYSMYLGQKSDFLFQNNFIQFLEVSIGCSLKIKCFSPCHTKLEMPRKKRWFHILNDMIYKNWWYKQIIRTSVLTFLVDPVLLIQPTDSLITQDSSSKSFKHLKLTSCMFFFYIIQRYVDETWLQFKFSKVELPLAAPCSFQNVQNIIIFNFLVSSP